MVNNLDWTAPLSAIDFLREIGKHFRVGTMLRKDAVASRLSSEEGISYTEFSYQILQGMDYLQLFRDYGCMLQTGGSDQWGNLTSGTELIRKVEGKHVHALGTPLITNSDGTKFGKSEGNAIWLDPAMCSPYAFYQFWLNTADADVADRLKVFTFLSRAEIEALELAVAERPFAREGQRKLAYEVTSLVHGVDATEKVIAASAAVFGNGDLTVLDEATLEGGDLRAAVRHCRRRRPGHHRTAGGLRSVGEQVRRPPHRGGGRGLRQQREGVRSRRRYRGQPAAARTLPAPAPGQEEPGHGGSRRGLSPAPNTSSCTLLPGRVARPGRSVYCFLSRRR